MAAPLGGHIYWLVSGVMAAYAYRGRLRRTRAASGTGHAKGGYPMSIAPMTIRESYCSWRTLGIGALTLAASLALAAPVSGQSGPAVTSLTLINADTEQPIAGFNPLPATAQLNLATLPTRNLNIRANTSPATVGSVRFGYDANPNFRTENGAPYAFAGDSSGNYLPSRPRSVLTP